jgi:hypothetical protein
MILPENRYPLFGIVRFRVRMSENRHHLFRDHARAKKKCAASPGGTFFHSIAGLCPVNTRARTGGCGLKFAARADSKGKPVGSWDPGVANACA